jgi:hypothetical protein
VRRRRGCRGYAEGTLRANSQRRHVAGQQHQPTPPARHRQALRERRQADEAQGRVRGPAGAHQPVHESRGGQACEYTTQRGLDYVCVVCRVSHPSPPTPPTRISSLLLSPSLTPFTIPIFSLLSSSSSPSSIPSLRSVSASVVFSSCADGGADGGHHAHQGAQGGPQRGTAGGVRGAREGVQPDEGASSTLPPSSPLFLAPRALSKALDSFLSIRAAYVPEVRSVSPSLVASLPHAPPPPSDVMTTIHEHQHNPWNLNFLYSTSPSLTRHLRKTSTHNARTHTHSNRWRSTGRGRRILTARSGTRRGAVQVDRS